MPTGVYKRKESDRIKRAKSLSSPEVREKMRLSHLGQKRTQEAIQR